MLGRLRDVCKRAGPSRSFSGGHHKTPGAATYSAGESPKFHANLSKGLFVLTYLWIMYQFKEDKGKLFGFYKPWLEEHEHEHEHHFKSTEFGQIILTNPDEEHEHDDHDNDGHDDDHDDEEPHDDEEEE